MESGAESEEHSQLPEEQEELQVILRRRPKNPTWLKKHQERFAEATRIAAEETKHLSGETRSRAMNVRISELVRGA